MRCSKQRKAVAFALATTLAFLTACSALEEEYRVVVFHAQDGLLFTEKSDSLPHDIFVAEYLQESQAAAGIQVGTISTGCVGTLVGKDLVLTAAHCVLNDRGGPTFTRLKFFIAEDRSFINQVWVPQQYTEGDSKYDWALLQLENPLGSSHGWKYISATSIHPDEEVLIHTAGINTNGSLSIELLPGKVLEVTEQHITTNISTISGTSGSPVTPISDEDKIVALHAQINPESGHSEPSLMRFFFPNL